MGTVLGLGPEGKRRGADRSLVRNYFARALGRIHSPTRAHDDGNLRQHRDQLFLVRGEYARRRPAFLRLHAKSLSMAPWLHDQPTGVDHDREYTARTMEKFSHSGKLA